MEVKQEAEVAAVHERVANLEREMGAACNVNKLSLEERVARLEASQGGAPLPRGRVTRSVECRNCRKLGHLMRECQEIICFGCGRRGHMQGSAREAGKQSGEVSEGRLASQPPSSDPGI